MEALLGELSVYADGMIACANAYAVDGGEFEALKERIQTVLAKLPETE